MQQNKKGYIMNVNKSIKILVNWKNQKSIDSGYRFCIHYASEGWKLSSNVRLNDITTFIYSI